MSMQNQRVVIERRSSEDVEWETGEGLKNFSLTPFGVIAEFENQALVSEFIPWSDVMKLQIFDTEFSTVPKLSVCPTCNGKGILEDGLVLCEECNGYGSIRKDEEDELENR